jgi:hypothetical protein
MTPEIEGILDALTGIIRAVCCLGIIVLVAAILAEVNIHRKDRDD